MEVRGEMSSEDPIILPTETVESRPIPPVETPVVKVSDIPGTVNVGDRVRPRATVYRSDGTTPIVGCPVDFFVTDTLGTMALGDRVKTDVAGEATATEYYYVGRPEGGTTVDFIIVTRRVTV